MRRIIQKAKCKKCYVVDVDPHLVEGTSGLLHLDPIRGLPISGTVRHAPLFAPGKKGDKIYFQWNTLLEVNRFDSSDAIIIDEEMVYQVGGVFLNDYVWVELAPNFTMFGNEEVHRDRGEVVGSPRFSFINKGDDVMFDSKLAHRIKASEYTSKNIAAVKLSDILLYR
jgi:hypothetical protein